jgi:hypothetical protein
VSCVGCLVFELLKVITQPKHSMLCLNERSRSSGRHLASLPRAGELVFTEDVKSSPNFELYSASRLPPSASDLILLLRLSFDAVLGVRQGPARPARAKLRFFDFQVQRGYFAKRSQQKIDFRHGSESFVACG